MNLFHRIAFLSFILPIAAGCGGEEPIIPSLPEQETKEEVTIQSSRTGMVFLWKEGSGYTFKISYEGREVTPYEDMPVRVEIFPADLKTSKFYKSGYKDVDRMAEGVVCMAELVTEAGSVFNVEDTYVIDLVSSDIHFSRKVEVGAIHNGDYAFNSYLMLREGERALTEEYEFFMPSLIYGSSSGLPSGAVGSNFSDDWVLAREERMGLPLAVMQREGFSIAIADINTDASTVKGDFGISHIVDQGMHFGSIGFFIRPGYPVLTYCYPGSEGERTYADGGSPSTKRWARRSHPVSGEVKHQYSLDLQFSRQESLPSAIRTHWRKTFDRYNPALLPVSASDVLSASLEVLDAYWMEDSGAPGWPFSVFLPSGLIHEISYDMGFVGMQVSCGYFLYRAGLEQGRPDWQAKGEAVLDWWAANSPNQEGMPRVWWDISPWNLWRNSNDLRNMQGGLEAMLLAWIQAEKHNPGVKSAWIDFCVRAAEWLLSKQNEDGSWDKAYDNAGKVIDSGRLLTTSPIRFLTYLYDVTGDQRYIVAAVKAGDYSLENIHFPYRYVGSVIDNPYVLDRESGQKALEAFLSLYEQTGQERWLDAAVQAAYYTVTYMYAWNIPQPQGNTKMAWDRNKSTVGITIIATGHSGADAGLAYNSYEYFRLYQFTGDQYFLKIAKLLEKNTKQTMNYDGSLGYAFKGLQTEALRLVTHWGDNVNLWLPWLTVAHLDPMFKFKDSYSQMEISQIEIEMQ